MDEVKIWSVDGDSNVEPLARKGHTDTESLLEETLVRNPDLLIPGLRLVGRQTPTAGGPLDLLGVDEDGRLVVFELKRGTLSRDAVAQIIDYASDLDAMDLDTLASHISKQSGKYGIEEIEDFHAWYSQDFGEQEGLMPPRMFLVGLGADDKTERMVSFLANNSSMDISLLTFQGFDYDGKTLLAKRVRVEGDTDNALHSAGRFPSGAVRKERLAARIEGSGVPDLFFAARDMFRENWHDLREQSSQERLNFRLSERTASGRRKRVSYACIEPALGKVRINFYPRAQELCEDGFGEAKQEIQYEPGTWDGLTFPLDPAAWEAHKDRLSELTRAVYEAWEISDQEAYTV